MRTRSASVDKTKMTKGSEKRRNNRAVVRIVLS
jgi:hypothetical protein